MTPHECKEMRKLLESYKRVNFDRQKRIQELIEENYELQKRIIELERKQHGLVANRTRKDGSKFD